MRQKIALLLLFLLMPVLVLNLLTLESNIIYQPNVSSYPKQPEKLLQDAPLFKEVQEISYQTQDGLDLKAWYYPASKGQKTIVFAHGNGGHMGDRFYTFKTLVEAGYGVAFFEYRGYGGNAGKPDERNCIDDLLTFSEYLASELNTPYSSQVLMGESLGGAVTIAVATHHDYAAVVVYSTFTKTPDVMLHLLKQYTGVSIPKAFGQRLVRQKFPSEERIKRVEEPLLIFHGDQDQMMPVSMPEILLKNAGSSNKKLLMIETAGHNDIFYIGKSQILKGLQEIVEN